MLGLSASGVYLAFLKSQPGNILGGTLTFYLVATAWMTAKRRNAETGILDWSALLVSLAVTAVTVTYGLEAAISRGAFMSAWFEAKRIARPPLGHPSLVNRLSGRSLRVLGRNELRNCIGLSDP